MRKASRWVQIGAAAVMVAFAGSTWAQQPIIYPDKRQSSEQQQKDRGECQVWATRNTGIDPVALALAPAPSGSAPGGERVRGAIGGAAGGAVIGEIASNEAGRGAAIGAILGTMRGHREARQNQAAAEQQARRQRQQQIDTWNRAFGACMEGRGYAVK